MSVVVCSDLHINTLVTWAANSALLVWRDERYMGVGDAPQFFAELLYAANMRSMNARYGTRERTTGFQYQRVPTTHVLPVHIIRLCHSYSYQACEHKQWERSDAKRFIDSIIREACVQLPGYAEAPWFL